MGLFGAKRTRRRIRDDGSLIVLDKVSKSYETGAPALNGVNLRVKKGEFVFIVGDSGSGKSTLIKLLLRELTPTSGTILVNGQNVAHLKQRQIPKYRRKLGIVFQDFRLLKDRNVYENVAFAQRVIQVPTREKPTGNLDPKNSWEIMKLLEKINEGGTTILVVTHNREIVNEMKKRVITMKKGVIVSDEEQGGYIDEN